MNEIYHVTLQPMGTVVQVPGGTPVSRLLFSRDIHVETPCGGAGKCGKCRIIAKGALSPLSDTE
ncbi:MAG: 2Fe-2S iron-sulfur cluster binding domain-containing protein, partial [Abditibacteriota bacterium]|nr:2Fe-2S iron-sulfur cluster binding domain-containing protein [Abditibacteriota bacterium]